jgi:cytochrome c peroxidase
MRAATFGASLSTALLGFVVAAHAAPPSQPIALSHSCPPSFEKVSSGVCKLRTLYELYSAPAGYGGLRAPLPPAHDGMRPEIIDLGRYLFFDPLLSADRTTACASCHDPRKGFSDGQPRARGRGAVEVQHRRSGGVTLKRGAPTLWNVAFLNSLDWDGRSTDLEQQARNPILNSDEMANTVEGVEGSLNDNAEYRRLFQQAFELGADARISFRQVQVALGAFEASLISLNSQYDRFAHGDSSSLSPLETRGLLLFDGFVARCSQCHTPPLFTNGQLAVIGAPESSGASFDHGAADLTPHRKLNGAFRVPSLRNIALTAPYMHSGAFATLEDVVNFYNRPHPVDTLGEQKIALHWNMHPEGLNLSEEEIRALVAFLNTLTDESNLPVPPLQLPSGLMPAPIQSTR